MNNDELKKKIMEVLNKNFTEEVECTPVYTTDDGKEIELPEELCEMFNDIVTQAVIPYFADALIAAGIGDVEESENKATAAELVAQVSASTAIEKIAEWKHRAEVAEKAFDLINKENPSCFVPYSCRGLDCIECAKKYFYEQAEKELSEEKKDD